MMCHTKYAHVFVLIVKHTTCLCIDHPICTEYSLSPRRGRAERVVSSLFVHNVRPHVRKPCKERDRESARMERDWLFIYMYSALEHSTSQQTLFASCVCERPQHIDTHSEIVPTNSAHHPQNAQPPAISCSFHAFIVDTISVWHSLSLSLPCTHSCSHVLSANKQTRFAQKSNAFDPRARTWSRLRMLSTASRKISGRSG